MRLACVFWSPVVIALLAGCVGAPREKSLYEARRDERLEQEAYWDSVRREKESKSQIAGDSRIATPNGQAIAAPDTATVVHSGSQHPNDPLESQKRVDCAKDRSNRTAARLARDEARRVQSEKERARMAFIEKNCKRTERTVEVPLDKFVVDPDGYVRRDKGLAVEIVFECPPSGPPGARGTVSARVGNGNRRVSSPDEMLQAARDMTCRRFDEEELDGGTNSAGNVDVGAPREN